MDERNGMGKEVNSPESFDALRYHEHGKPIEVLRLEKLSISPCASGEVTIQMEAAALHPSDIGLIVGSYGTLRSLPTVAGREGVGTFVRWAGEWMRSCLGDRWLFPLTPVPGRNT